MKSTIPRHTLFLLAFAGLNIFWRALFLPVNQSAYTDGILQIDMFRQGVSYWPPVYALLTRLVAWIPGLGLEGGGRLVSFLCGVLVLWPLMAITRRLFGLRAAFWAMAAWTVTPLALQWSLQVMTDMPFTLFWLATLAAALIAIECVLPGMFPNPEAAGPANAVKGTQWLLIASFCGALATLTRYQGILLIAPLALAAWRIGRIGRALPGRRALNSWITLLPWLAVPVWALQGIRSLQNHAQQIGARTGMGTWDTLVNYLYLFEEFLLKSPYFLTYGLFGFLLYGLFRIQWGTARLRWSGWVCLYLGLAIFAMQAVFMSYQARYLLPLVPLACIFTGHGIAVWERHNQGRPLIFWGLVLPTLGWGLAFSALVAVYQGNPFKDIKSAAQYVGEKIPAGRRVFSNETYNRELNRPVKVGFWAGGREILFVDPIRLLMEPASNPLRPGDIIVLSSYNVANLELYNQIRRELLKRAPAHELKKFARFAYPLITDIMQEGGTAQNPLAWELRYQPQYYETTILEVEGTPPPAPPGSEPLKPIPLSAVPRSADKVKEIKALQQEIRDIKALGGDAKTTSK